jgi:hypothetical protein
MKWGNLEQREKEQENYYFRKSCHTFSQINDHKIWGIFWCFAKHLCTPHSRLDSGSPIGVEDRLRRNDEK